MGYCKAIIIDDEVHALKLLQMNLEELFPEIKVVKTCTGWEEALQALKADVFDLIFIDVMMPGKSGVELIRLLPALEGKVIFVTAHQQYAFEAFRCYAFGYLLKPVDETELFAVVSRAITLMASPATKGILGIPSIIGIDYVPLEDILYVQSYNKCTKVVLKDKMIVSSYPIGKFRESLPPTDFFQVHRSCIVNLKAVKRYMHSSSGLIMPDNTEIPVARSVRKDLLKQFATIAHLS